MRLLKIIVAGSGAAGKTNFINLLMQRKFEKDHHSTNVAHANHAVSFRMATFKGSSEEGDEVMRVKLDSKLEISYLQSVLLPKHLPKPKLAVSSIRTVDKRDTAKAPLSSNETPVNHGTNQRQLHNNDLF